MQFILDEFYHPALHLTFHQSKKIIILNKHFHYLHILYRTIHIILLTLKP